MKLANPTAFTPFMQDDIVVRSARRNETNDSVKVRAYVTQGNPYALAVGLAAAAEQWSVAFEEKEWISPIEIVAGMSIDADKIANKFPRLTIQSVYHNGGLIIFLCSGRERGVL